MRSDTSLNVFLCACAASLMAAGLLQYLAPAVLNPPEMVAAMEQTPRPVVDAAFFVFHLVLAAGALLAVFWPRFKWVGLSMAVFGVCSPMLRLAIDLFGYQTELTEARLAYLAVLVALVVYAVALIALNITRAASDGGSKA